MSELVQVAVPRPVPGPFTYQVPALLSGTLALGHPVLVPFGNRGSLTGWVVGHTTQRPPGTLKSVQRLLDPLPAFDADQYAFFRWIADYYLAPVGQVIHTAMPSRMQAKVLTVARASDAGVDALAMDTASGMQAQVLREVVSRPGLTRRGLAQRLSGELESKQVAGALGRLVERGWVVLEDKEIRESRSTITTVELVADWGGPSPRGSRMKALLASLHDAQGPMDLGALLDEHGQAARQSVKRLEELGAVTLDEREQRDPLDLGVVPRTVAPQLNPDQRVALERIDGDPEGAFLLYGVTGSGKTEVFLGAARHTLQEGRQVLVLVPEIGLTPQLVRRFKGRFGDDVAVLHSGLTGAERLAQWRRIRAGEARVAVGARSALFAPFADLGLVVVDEEHDDSYKQDEGVSYSARDLALVLARRSRGKVVLASATPSLESWRNAELGRYELLRLPRRATPRPVPDIEVIDLKALPRDKGTPPPVLAPRVKQALDDTFARGLKAIVLYNRRGFATVVSCTSCGGSYECPSCGISMTLHQRAGVVRCHYCGFSRPYTDLCPACGESDCLEELGRGTERIESELQTLFPGIGLVRMDADTTRARGAHQRLLDRFGKGDAQLLVGTQIVAKGHDFPDVHTAVVVSADHGLRMPDFRAAERTYALLVQLAGRAGRGDVPGQVFVQSWDPSHYVIQHLGDVDGFLTHEQRLRDALGYPPHRRLVLVRLEGVDRRTVDKASHILAHDLRAEAQRTDGVVDILGPAPAALPRLVGRWRYQVVLRGRDDRIFRLYLRNMRERLLAGAKGVRVHVDVDPRHLL